MIIGVPQTVPFQMFDLVTGALTASLTFATSDIIVSRAGGAWANFTGTASETGGAGNGLGSYDYLPAAGDVVSGGFRFRVQKTGYAVQEFGIFTETAQAQEATLATVATYVDTEVAAIKAKTDNLPADPASAATLAASFVTVNANIAVVAGYIDTEITTLLANLATANAGITAAAAQLALVLGLLHYNARIDNTTYNGNGLMTAGRLRVFANYAALTASVSGHADGADSEIQRYAITCADEGDGTVATYTLGKVL